MQRPVAALLLCSLIIISSATALVPLTQEANAASDYRFTDLDGPDTVTQEDTIQLEGTVVNVGDTSSSRVVKFYFDGYVVDRQRVQLDSDESERITVEYTVPDNTEGAVYYGMTNRGNSLYDSLTVEPKMEEMQNETEDDMNDMEEMRDKKDNNSDDGIGSGDGRLDPQLAFFMIFIILLVVGGYVAYEIFTGQ